MITYIAKEGDVLDWIVWKHYGTTFVLGKVMKANPSIVNEALKSGTVVKLPHIESVQKPSKEIRLWS